MAKGRKTIRRLQEDITAIRIAMEQLSSHLRAVEQRFESGTRRFERCEEEQRQMKADWDRRHQVLREEFQEQVTDLGRANQKGWDGLEGDFEVKLNELDRTVRENRDEMMRIAANQKVFIAIGGVLVSFATIFGPMLTERLFGG